MIGIFDDSVSTRKRLSMAFNGLTMNQDQSGATGPVDAIEVNNIAPKTQYSAITDPKPNKDGTEVYESRRVARIIRIDGVIRSPTYGRLYDQIEAMAVAFDPALTSYNNPGTEGFLNFTFSTPTVNLTSYPTGLIACQYSARGRGMPEPLIGQYTGLNAAFTVELFLKDAKRFSQTQYTQTFSGSASHTLNNTLADYRSFPTVTITMSGAGNALYAIANNTISKSLVLNLSGTANADVIVINMETYTITKNGVETPSLYVSGDYWVMNPGNNSVQTTNGASSSSVVAWRNAFTA